MHNKKASFDRIFTSIRAIGIADLMKMWEARIFNSHPDIESLINIAQNNRELLAKNKTYVVISDFKTMKTLYVSSYFENLTGLPVSDFSSEFFLKSYCRADANKGLQILNSIQEHQKRKDIPDKYLFQYTSNYRFLNSRGYYTWMLNRIMFLRHDENNQPHISFSLVTDIDNFKTDDKLGFSRLKYQTETGEYELEHFEEYSPEGINLLSKTDLQILKLMSEGHDNREISIELNLSEHTIRDYRKKMLQKTWCNNLCELVTFVLRNNLI